MAWTKLAYAIEDELTGSEVAPVSLVTTASQPPPKQDGPAQAKNGIDYLQVVETDNAVEGVAHWQIKAVGGRPIDYVGREFLHGSMLRDHRPRFFHKYAERGADWMVPLIEHLADERERRIAEQHLALHFLHRRHLLHRIEDQRELGDFADERECTLLAALWCCTPHGVLVDWAGPGARTPGHRCNHTWFCPWCLARRVVDLYERLHRGPLEQPTGKHLVLGRAQMEGNLFDRVGDDLNPAESRAIRKHLGGLLKNEALRVGVTGGLVTYQLGPGLHDISPARADRVLGFQHELAILGEVELGHHRQQDRLLDQLRAVTLGPHPNGQDIHLRWLLMPADQIQSLRLLLVGSAPGFDLDRVEWLTADVDDRDFIARKGVCGTFALQPLFMLDQRRWQFYRMAVDRMHLFDVFGSWRPALRAVQGTQPTDPFMTDHQRAFQVLNGRKRREVADRRSRLLERVKSLTCLFDSSGTGQRGRPPRSRQLATLLQEHGITVSDRDLRWLKHVL